VLVRRALIAAAAVTAFHAAPALAGDRFVARDEPVPAAVPGRVAKALAGRSPVAFNLLGLHWRGSGTVSFRTALQAGAWGEWHEAVAEAEDGPDSGSAEARAARRWKLGSPFWTGPARYVQYRFSGVVHRLRAYYLWSEPTATTTTTESAERGTLATSPRAARPSIVTRAEWRADESIVRDSPSYASRLHFAVVHHTAGTNSYSASDSPAIVRGIQRYHVLANGWDDIGYNALVDKYGQVFEGRAGGLSKNVVGAHAQGFNTGSVGVAVLGTYESRGISSAAFRALRNFLAWRLDVAHVDPTRRLTWTSGGNPEYPAGTPVRIRTIAGHGDTGPTSCPGSGLRGQLPGLRSAVDARGLPKIYDPAVSGALGGPVRVTARLSSSLGWTVTIRDSSGATVATGSGSGTSVDYTWDASAVFFGAYTYTIVAGMARHATYSIPGPPKLRIRSLVASPSVLTPNDDGVGEATAITFRLTTAATTTVTIETAGGATRRTLASGRSLRAGSARFVWDGRDGSGSLVADGEYRVHVAAASPGQSAAAAVPLVVDRTLGSVEASPGAFSPNGDRRAETTAVSFMLARAATVRVRARRGGRTKATLFNGPLSSGEYRYVWNGRTADGAFPDGRYALRVEATSALGTRKLYARVVLDTVRPRLRVVGTRRRPSRTKVLIWLSEPAALHIWWGSPTWRDGRSRRIASRPAGTSSFRVSGHPRQIRVAAWDPARNRSRYRRLRL
jgi:hypothetical protein